MDIYPYEDLDVEMEESDEEDTPSPRMAMDSDQEITPPPSVLGKRESTSYITSDASPKKPREFYLPAPKRNSKRVAALKTGDELPSSRYKFPWGTIAEGVGCFCTVEKFRLISYRP